MLENFFSDKITSSVTSLFLVLYAGMASPELPSLIKNAFSNSIFRMLVLSLIVYKGNKDPQLAITIAIAFTLTMNYLRDNELKEEFGEY
jgi:hypothetical protein|tara:strand:+ start:306 stop:572 length:267 start_codon:yes stop_codon:yes gene_type:complete